MKKLSTLLVIAVAALAVGAGGAGASHKAASPKTVTVAMHDPGCHWFSVAGTYRKSLSVSGPVYLLNADEAALKIVGRTGPKLDRVGHKLLLTHGKYHITMVGQAPDDNHLLLVVG